MAEGKSLYENPSNRGAAAILGNAWQTPLALLQQSEQQKRLDAQNAAKLKKEEEKALMERVKNFTPELGDMWENDLEAGSAAVTGIRDFMSENQANGKDVTNAALFPREHAELNRRIQDANNLVTRSKQQKASYDAIAKELGGDKAAYYDTKKGYEMMEQYRMAKTPEERTKIQLELKRLHKPVAYAGDVMKSIGDPEMDTEFDFQRDGSIITKKIKTYSPEQMDKASFLLREVPQFREFIEDEYEQMSEEERNNAGGLKGLEEARSKEYIDSWQRTDIEKNHGANAQLNANRSHALALKREARQAAKDVAEAGKSEDNVAMDRVEWLESVRTGDVDKVKSLINSKVGGKSVLSAGFKNSKGISVQRGEKIGTKDLFNLKETPIIELEVAVGDVTNDDGTFKTKSTQTQKVEVDMSKPGWEEEVSIILNTLSGAKGNVTTEKLNEMKMKRKLFQEGAKTYDPKLGDNEVEDLFEIL